MEWRKKKFGENTKSKNSKCTEHENRNSKNEL